MRSAPPVREQGRVCQWNVHLRLSRLHECHEVGGLVEPDLLIGYRRGDGITPGGEGIGGQD